jgi:hypothetical protein
MKKLFLILFLISSLFARSNPFEETIDIKDTALPEIGVTPEEEKQDFLNSVSVDLPDGSKKVNSVIIEYVDKNGITNRKTVRINKQLSGSNPIVIAQSSQVNMKVLPISSASPDRRLNKVKSIDNDRSSINTNGFISIVGSDYSPVEEFKPFPFLKIRLSDNEIVLDTRKQVLRDFVITNPTKIVIDLARVPSFNSKSLKPKNRNLVKSLSFGAHRDFFRVAIEIPKNKRYKVYKQASGGCKIVFR